MKPELTKEEDILEKLRIKGRNFYRKYQDKAFEDVIKE